MRAPLIIEDDLKEAQSQLQEIFNEIVGPSAEEPTQPANSEIAAFDERLTKIEALLNSLVGGNNNGPKESNVNVERVSEVA